MVVMCKQLCKQKQVIDPNEKENVENNICSLFIKFYLICIVVSFNKCG
jgi:hypothetical protein